ncbi:MAG: class I SAM-dependent methyltransferase [Actinomycetota bacterium]
MHDSYDAYGHIARGNWSPTVTAGRYQIQEAAESLAAQDIAGKLALDSSCRLLEIGCGPGSMLKALTPLAREAVGIDHPNVIQVARNRLAGLPVTLVEGRFPEVMPAGQFDRIVIYSVLHYCRDLDAVSAFLDAALSLLPPGGILLAGDLPNSDRKARFLASPEGEVFQRDWAERMAANTGAEALEVLGTVPMIKFFADQDIRILEERYSALGYRVEVLDQPPDLPFGYTREDLRLTASASA